MRAYVRICCGFLTLFCDVFGGKDNSVFIVGSPLGEQRKYQWWWREPLLLPSMVCRLHLYVCIVLGTAIVHPRAFVQKAYWRFARLPSLTQGIWNTFGCHYTMSSSTARQAQRQGAGRGGKSTKGVGDADIDAARKELIRIERRREAKTNSEKVFWWL